MTLSKKSMMMVGSAAAASLALAGVSFATVNGNKDYSINATGAVSSYSLIVTSKDVPTTGSDVATTINGNTWTFNQISVSEGQMVFAANGYIRSCTFPNGWTNVHLGTVTTSSTLYVNGFNTSNDGGVSSNLDSNKDYLPNTSAHNSYFVIKNVSGSPVSLSSFTVTYNCAR
jgi:hypothetical protein